MYPPLDPLYNPCNPRAPAVNVIACCGMDKFVNRHLSQRAKSEDGNYGTSTITILKPHRTGCYDAVLPTVATPL